jgi:hypothetical protein
MMEHMSDGFYFIQVDEIINEVYCCIKCLLSEFRPVEPLKCSNAHRFDEDIVVLQLDMNLIKAELDSESETDPSYSHNENELTARNKKEDPLIISFPVMKTENVVSCVGVRT